jgi:hypothetical protein
MAALQQIKQRLETLSTSNSNINGNGVMSALQTPTPLSRVVTASNMPNTPTHQDTCNDEPTAATLQAALTEPTLSMSDIDAILASNTSITDSDDAAFLAEYSMDPYLTGAPYCSAIPTQQLLSPSASANLKIESL